MIKIFYPFRATFRRLKSFSRRLWQSQNRLKVRLSQETPLKTNGRPVSSESLSHVNNLPYPPCLNIDHIAMTVAQLMLLHQVLCKPHSMNDDRPPCCLYIRCTSSNQRYFNCFRQFCANIFCKPLAFGSHRLAEQFTAAAAAKTSHSHQETN